MQRLTLRVGGSAKDGGQFRIMPQVPECGLLEDVHAHARSCSGA